MAGGDSNSMAFRNTRISLNRGILSYSKVQILIGTLVRNRRFQLSRIRAASDYVNVGCGAFPLEGFCNIDYIWGPRRYCFDVTRGIPLATASVKGIFSEHCLEYLKVDQCLAVLRDFRRILKPGGVARIVLPDGGLYCRLYMQAISGEAVTWPYPELGKPPIYYVNRIMSGYGHYSGFIYDFEAFKEIMLSAGFREVHREAYLQGRDPRLLVEQERRAIESFYAEGIA
jgi:predicted SAM-dependent methyltransferase